MNDDEEWEEDAEEEEGDFNVDSLLNMKKEIGDTALSFIEKILGVKTFDNLKKRVDFSKVGAEVFLWVYRKEIGKYNEGVEYVPLEQHLKVKFPSLFSDAKESARRDCKVEPKKRKQNRRK